MPTHEEAAVRIWFRMLRLQARMDTAISLRLKQFGLSIPQCDVLATLTEREGISQQDLAARLYVTKGNISGLLDRLATAGLVERRPTETDRRAHAIFLTNEGRNLALRAIAAQRAFVIETLGQMNRQRLAELETLVVETRDLIRENAKLPKPRKRERAGDAAPVDARRR